MRFLNPKKIVLISKDAFGVMNLPQYGNIFWKTPNINRVVANGTIFMKHYTTAPSTGMAFSSMFTGKYPFELKDRKKYIPVSKYSGETLFDRFKKEGYSCHIIWDKCFNSYALPFANCFGEDDGTIIHSLDIREPVGGHKIQSGDIVEDSKKTQYAMQSIINEIRNIENNNDNIFLWIHLPHVISGRTGYGSDIDTVDELVGWFIENWGIDSIFLTGDHGHMNLTKNKIGYGWDLGESAIRVPLITPRIENKNRIDFPTSHVDLASIIFDRKVVERAYLVVDTAYYAQPKRKTAIITNDYKFIYDKYTGKEYLYDIKFDPNENYNLLIRQKYDPERLKIITLSEVCFYPYQEKVPNIYLQSKNIINTLWKTGSKKEEFCERAKLKLLHLKLSFLKKIKEKKQVKDKNSYDPSV